MSVDQPHAMKYCLHCGAPDALRLGDCKICHEMVCEKCGNTQFCQGVRNVIHDSCLKKDKGNDSGFSMIKFVK